DSDGVPSRRGVTKLSPCCAAGGDERIFSIVNSFCFFHCLLDRGHITEVGQPFFMFFDFGT
ncbi:MAG: hypothetical protein IKA82_00180, partial [Clostridia bacterium]|nr:hypothetical protein [Clostridia bacterium]